LKHLYLVIVATLFWPATGFSAMSTLEFADNAQRERYVELTRELRCLVCQNQSLADSDADLAQDLRKEVYNMFQQGKTDQQIIEFLVARYWDFVLYRPPVKPSTAVLWVGPFLLLFLGLGVLIYSVKRRRHATQMPVLSPEDRERLERLERLDGSDKGNS
jgi:cytochrome c-type biogenesis protein CcmH